MLSTRDQVLDNYYNYFKKRLPDFSQEGINYLVIRFLGEKIKADIYDEEAAGQIFLALTKINKANKIIIDKIEELKTGDTTLVNSEAIFADFIKIKQAMLAAEVFPLLQGVLAKIKPKQEKKENYDEMIFRLIEVILNYDKDYQELNLHHRMLENIKRDPLNDKKLQIERQKNQLLKIKESVVNNFQNLIAELYKLYNVTDLQQLDKLKNDLAADEKISPTIRSSKLERIERNIKFIKDIQTRIVEINKLAESLNNKMPEAEFFKIFYDVNNKFNELLKIVKKEKTHHTGLETDARRAMEQNKEDAKQDAASNQQTTNKDSVALADYHQEASKFSSIFNNLNTWLEKTKPDLDLFYDKIQKLEKNLPILEIENIAKTGSDTEKKNADSILQLFKKMELSPNFYAVSAFSADFKSEILDRFKRYSKLPAYLPDKLSLELRFHDDLFSTYVVQNLPSISSAVYELKHTEEAKLPFKPTTENMALIKRIEDIINKINEFKDKALFLKTRLQLLMGYHFSIPFSLQELILDEAKALCDTSFLNKPAQLPDKKEYNNQSNEILKERDNYFENAMQQQVTRLNEFFMFEKIKELIIKGHDQPAVQELIISINKIIPVLERNKNKSKESKEEPLPPLPEVFKSLSDDVKNALIEYLLLREDKQLSESHLDVLQTYKDKILEEKKQTPKDFDHDWKAAIQNLKQFKGKVGDPNTLKKFVEKHIPQPNNLAPFEDMKYLIIKWYTQPVIQELLAAVRENKPFPAAFKSLKKETKDRLIDYLKDNVITLDNMHAMSAWTNTPEKSKDDKQQNKKFINELESAVEQLKNLKDNLPPTHPLLEHRMLDAVMNNPTFNQLINDLQNGWKQLQALMPPAASPAKVEQKQTDSSPSTPSIGIANLSIPLVTPKISSDRASQMVVGNATEVRTPQFPPFYQEYPDVKDANTVRAPHKPTKIIEMDEDEISLDASLHAATGENKPSGNTPKTPDSSTNQPGKSPKVEGSTLVTPPGTRIHRRSTAKFPSGTPSLMPTAGNDSNTSTPRTPNLTVPTNADAQPGTQQVKIHKRNPSYQPQLFQPKTVSTPNPNPGQETASTLNPAAGNASPGEGQDTNAPTKEQQTINKKA